jgi:hypothetical protein
MSCVLLVRQTLKMHVLGIIRLLLGVLLMLLIQVRIKMMHSVQGRQESRLLRSHLCLLAVWFLPWSRLHLLSCLFLSFLVSIISYLIKAT